jgi:hydroxymethylbilane synthase
MSSRPILGTRGSPLAMVQAHKVASALEVANRWPADHIEIRPIKTTGDKVQDRPLAEIGGKMLWTKELDRALVEGEIDFAVHSLKDVEAVRPDGIRIAAVRPRGDVRETLIGADSIDALKDGAVVGTSSPRRAAQLLSMRPDLKIVPLRGNVDTRLAKLAAGEVDATLLTTAGLRRLGRTGVGVPIPIEQMLPAPTQAIIAIECRSDDAMTQGMLTIIDDRSTHAIANVERAFVRALGGNCHSPVAALAVIEDGEMWMRAELYSADGRDKIADVARFGCSETKAAAALARAMLARAPDSIRQLFADA